MAQVRVDVTAEDIAGGLRRYACLCPVAQAASRALGCRVGLHARLVGAANKLFIEFAEHHISVPDEVALWVESFDMHRPVEPFSFTLEVP